MTNTAKVREAVAEIRRQWPTRPRVGIVLGTGLGQLSTQIDASAEIQYAAIPHFPVTTAMGHAGRLVCGTLAGVPVVAMDGRHHAYEGYTTQDIGIPIRILKQLGIERLVLSNASGGLNPRLAQGDILVIDDHINLICGRPCLAAPDRVGLGRRLRSLPSPYDPQLIDCVHRIARQLELPITTGVYAAVIGPNYETRAEYRFLRRIGADVVGMSTVPEVIVAHHLRLPVLAMSAVTNVCRPDCFAPTDGHAVIAAAQSTEPRMRDIVTRVVADVADD